MHIDQILATRAEDVPVAAAATAEPVGDEAFAAVLGRTTGPARASAPAAVLPPEPGETIITDDLLTFLLFSPCGIAVPAMPQGPLTDPAGFGGSGGGADAGATGAGEFTLPPAPTFQPPASSAEAALPAAPPPAAQQGAQQQAAVKLAAGAFEQSASEAELPAFDPAAAATPERREPVGNTAVEIKPVLDATEPDLAAAALEQASQENGGAAADADAGDVDAAENAFGGRDALAAAESLARDEPNPRASAAAGGPPPAHTVDHERLADIMAQHAARGGGRMKVQMHPPELGQLRIEVLVRGEHVGLRFEVDSSSSAAAISRDLGGLREALESRGFAVDRADVFLGAGDGSSAGRGGAWGAAGGSDGDAEAEGRWGDGAEEEAAGIDVSA